MHYALAGIHGTLEPYDNCDLRYAPIYYSKYYDLYVEEIIPLMERYGILKSVCNNNTQQVGTRAWALKDYDLTAILQGETDHSSPLHKFWKEENTHGKVRRRRSYKYEI